MDIIREKAFPSCGRCFHAMRAVALLLAAGVGLSACLPAQGSKDALRKDFVEAAARQNALAALSFSRSAQQALTTHPDWINKTLATGDFDGLGVAVPAAVGLARFKAGYCRDVADADGHFREVLVVWPESVETAAFALKGLGRESGLIVSKAMADLAGEASVGIMKSGTLMTAGWNEEVHTTLLPASCDTFALPEGTPVLAMEMARKTGGTQAMAQLGYRFEACSGFGENGAVINSGLTTVDENGAVVNDPEAIYRDKCF